MPPASPDQLFAYSDSLGIGQSFARPSRTRKLLGLRSVTRRYKPAIGLDECDEPQHARRSIARQVSGAFSGQLFGSGATFCGIDGVTHGSFVRFFNSANARPAR